NDDEVNVNLVPPILVNNNFAVTNLVTDFVTGGGAHVDPRLINPWGLTFAPTGLIWSANNGTGTATVYDANGTPTSLVVQIPSVDSPIGGVPTGIVFNQTSSFVIPDIGVATFIFASEDGIISAWNSVAGTSARVVVNRSSTSAVYKGIAILANGGENFLYATDFRNNAIDIFDSTFMFVRSVTDPSIPAGFAPFGIQAIGGKLYVTFAKQQGPDNVDDVAGVGNGFVSVFNADGTVSRRFASNGSLNSPWGVALAPAGFGPFSGAILIGNFGDGKIGAYDAANGGFIDFLRNGVGSPVVIDGLWTLRFGPGTGSLSLFFSAGTSNETHGLIGKIFPR
ncbi:MAG TPA: TIGR03118 family protein, partial [Gemmatimonadaceae bacterium]